MSSSAELGRSFIRRLCIVAPEKTNQLQQLRQTGATLHGFPSLHPAQPFFSGTRSLSPMSSLFGSIWTPQSEHYQSHFQSERSAPMSPVSPITPPHSPFIREPVGPCRPIQYSSFNPFGPHMNLDIWNSSSNRSSNSQLSNDSGYCGDV